MDGATGAANPSADAQHHARFTGTAVAASLAGRLPLPNLNQAPTRPGSFVAQHIQEHPDTGVGGALGNAPILRPSLDVERLDLDRLGARHDLACGLVRVVLADVGDTLVQPCDSLLGLVAAVASFDPAAHPALISLQSLLMPAKRAELRYLADARSIVDGGQGLEAHVDANALNGRGVDLWCSALENAGHVPLVRFAVHAAGQQAAFRSISTPELHDTELWQLDQTITERGVLVDHVDRELPCELAPKAGTGDFGSLALAR